jgi:cytochrome b
VVETKENVLVWDIWVRLFHWFNLVAFFVAYMTPVRLVFPGHLWSGYAVLALVTFRVAWGFVGSKHARFSDFLYSPLAVLGNLRDIVLFRQKRYLGHGPAAGVMVILLLLGLLATAISGVVLHGAEQAGPLAGMVPAADWRQLRHIHALATNITIGLVFVHVLGALLSAVTRNDDLVGAMLSGRKRA